MKSPYKYIKPWIKEVEPYIPGKTVKGYVKLASNENNYGPSHKVLRVLEEKKSLVNVYPHMQEEVKEKIAEYCNIERENIIIGNGSDELIDLILKTFKGPIIALFPTFSGYKICSQILGERYSDIKLNPDFGFPTEKFIEKSKNSRIIFLCSPNNPTGTVIREDDIRKILDEGKITVIDEAYYEFYGKTVVDLIDEYENLIVLRTFAKAFALAGLRIGYGISNENIISLIHRVKQPFNVNSFAEYAAIAALEDIEYMKKIVGKIKKDRRTLFDKLSEKFRPIPSEANFILVDVSPLSSEEFCDKLYEKKIIVRNFGRFEGFDGEYVRISIGTSEENRKLISVLEDLFF
ncbi:MAG: histidinol-phosphate transaminase [Candidatus Altiarchaeales archaeon]|nr:MAG: histidinol-phosphate transaminase [Candidatus Altiarchaeales archaeon]RLI95471.1 MAG: histidinol-phosphate transaminase [Candidatus Altiarchaeales archaeon]HDO82423.1 histidinol-phosphate transaminase [Candidatus Altiarchaeales archaeon]HEX55072.1 histidinol-phosphate transaminase [Candidatus Altiarchaeales archaeon]